jgi:GNAT superfamily N-acetyltransferase
MGAVAIRSARPDDLARMVELLQLGSLVGGDDEDDVDDGYATALVEIQATPGCDVLVAAMDGVVVGVCQLIVFRHLQHRGGRCAEVESVHVHPDHRGTGVGALLLEAAVERARAAGCYRVQLTSNVARVDAHRFYRRQGFEPTHLGFKRVLGAG